MTDNPLSVAGSSKIAATRIIKNQPLGKTRCSARYIIGVGIVSAAADRL